MVNTKFPLEKILTVNISQYCESKGKKLTDYELIGVHVDNDLGSQAPLISRFQEKVPINTEVVVSFRYAVLGATQGSFMGSLVFTNQYASGTALITK